MKDESRVASMSDYSNSHQSMNSNPSRSGQSLVLTAPILWMVLAATAIPIEFRHLGPAPLTFGFGFSDFVENVLGFVPVGMVLAQLGLTRAVLIAAAMSLLAEISQIWMMHRTPEVADVVANVIGGTAGAYVSVRYGIRMPALPLNRLTTLGAVVATAGLTVAILLTSADPYNTRGVTDPGAIEAEWRFDERDGREAFDTSGHNLTGSFRGQPVHVAGVRGGALQFDGLKDHIRFRHSTPLRFKGSMTITAWINSSKFPFDDAAIVSQLTSSSGYQLDTTIDKGPRTIGFKLYNSCGELMARYGATPLVTGTWYHIAGVYDADAKTMDVYLNGKPDDGPLVGTVTGSQLGSRSTVFVGRRELKDFEFAGSTDDVRIYSAPLTHDEVVDVMHGKKLENLPPPHPIAQPGPACSVLSDSADGRFPGAVATAGVLIAIASAGLWPTGGRWLGLAAGLAAGYGVYTTRAVSLPSFNLWMMPLVSFLGGLSVALSIKSRRH